MTKKKDDVRPLSTASAREAAADARSAAVFEEIAKERARTAAKTARLRALRLAQQ